jgi:hypothetical protein
MSIAWAIPASRFRQDFILKFLREAKDSSRSLGCRSRSACAVTCAGFASACDVRGDCVLPGELPHGRQRGASCSSRTSSRPRCASMPG